MQLQDSLARFHASNIRVFAISTDSVEDLATFATAHGIQYPLLSDPESSAIRAFGILNTLIREGEPEYGIPYPGSYLVGTDGRVTAKSFHAAYQVREAPATVLRSGFGVEPESASTGIVDPASGVLVDVVLSASTLSFMQLADLYVTLHVPPGIHVYGSPIPDGYVALNVQVTAAEGVRVHDPVYPRTRPFRVSGLDEAFNVFEGTALTRIPIVLATRPSDAFTELEIEVEIAYQACTSEMCFAPTGLRARLTIPLEA